MFKAEVWAPAAVGLLFVLVIGSASFLKSLSISINSKRAATQQLERVVQGKTTLQTCRVGVAKLPSLNKYVASLKSFTMKICKSFAPHTIHCFGEIALPSLLSSITKMRSNDAKTRHSLYKPLFSRISSLQTCGSTNAFCWRYL